MLKYTYKPDRYSSHSKIIKLVSSLKRSHLQILDIGCAQGYLAKELSAKGHKVTGIELNSEAAKQAKKYCKKVIVGDIEKLTPKFKKNYFDLIIFGDVLEHLKNPALIIKKYLSFLNKPRFVIASTGNIANIYIRLNLLFGRFNYSNRGILDKTHFHLYTLKTFKQLIKKANMKILKTEVTPIPLPMIIPLTAKGKSLNFIHQLNYLFTRLWGKLFGFQFIILAKLK